MCGTSELEIREAGRKECRSEVDRNEGAATAHRPQAPALTLGVTAPKNAVTRASRRASRSSLPTHLLCSMSMGSSHATCDTCDPPSRFPRAYSSKTRADSTTVYPGGKAMSTSTHVTTPGSPIREIRACSSRRESASLMSAINSYTSPTSLGCGRLLARDTSFSQNTFHLASCCGKLHHHTTRRSGCRIAV